MRRDARRASGGRRVWATAIAVALLAAGPALGACLAPTPPDPAGKPEKPVVPAKTACTDAKPGTAGCLGWESFAYNDAVKAFNAKVPAFQAAANAYVGRLNDYVKATSDYARCEAQSLQ